MSVSTGLRQPTILVESPAASSLVVVTTVDRVLRDPHTRSCECARRALAVLADQGIPVVLIADTPADEMLDVLHELELEHPFVCDGGSALYVPRGYFSELTGVAESHSEWDVMEFRAARGAADAVRLLVALYKSNFDDAVVIGLVDSWADRGVLEQVDVPVIVRNDEAESKRLLRRLPAAYVTRAAGPAGWSEAILGSVAEGT
jgi:predicted mannosyl-3-phosphoglycerate phosphatase (HAD superfamily)